MMADEEDGIAALAVGLNEDAKAKRAKKSKVEQAVISPNELGDGERWQEGDLLPGFSYDLDGYVIDEDGARTGARRPPNQADDDLVDPPEQRGDGLESQHTTAIERMENMAEDAVLETKSMVQDVRDFLLDQIKSRPKPWSATSNGEQRDVAAACEHAARELVRKVVEGIAAEGKVAIRALLENYSEKDGIKASLKIKVMSEGEALEAIIGLHKAVGKHVLITVASADDYTEPREAETDHDEPGLEFEAGAD